MSVNYHDWNQLPIELKDNLFHQRDAIIKFQALARRFIWFRRHQMDVLLKLLDEQYTSLMPEGTRILKVAELDRSKIRLGEHLVVAFHGGKIHHGIVVQKSSDNRTIKICDFSSPTPWDILMRDAIIRERDLTDFLSVYTEFGVVEYPSDIENEGGERRRERAIVIANHFVQNAECLCKLFPYHFIYRNCDGFVTMCMSGGHEGRSEQSLKVLKIISQDLRKGSRSKIWQFIVAIVAILYQMIIRSLLRN